MAERPLLVLVSDIHLTDALHGSVADKAAQFERFWARIQAARGHRPAELCFVGDVFDLVRSPSWHEGKSRPYHGATNLGVVKTVERIVHATIAREQAFFTGIRTRVERGELIVHYVLGNHDRLLRGAPAARLAISRALTGGDQLSFERELEFREHGVLAYHGNASDPINASADGDATIGDAIGAELILRFPAKVRAIIGADHPGLAEIDDVEHHVDCTCSQIDAGHGHRLLLMFDRNDSLERVLDQGHRIRGIAILHALLVGAGGAARVHHPEGLFSELQNAHRAVGDGDARKDQVRDELGIAIAAGVGRKDRIDDGGGAGIQGWLEGLLSG